MSNWRLGPEHPDYGRTLGMLTGPHRTWRVGERRPCARHDCDRVFTIPASLPDQRFCSLACADRAQECRP